MSVEILAEPGSTHEGRVEWMLDLIDLAKTAGCDAIKWQFLSSATRLCDRRRAPNYHTAYTLIQGDATLWTYLVKETHARGLQAIATAYLPEDVQPIADSGVDAIKIASFEASDGALLRRAEQTGRPLYVSTGMMSALEVQEIFAHCTPAVLFHCASVYPAPPETLNLRVLTQWDRVFRHHRIGFSDHSAEFITGALAVAAGAEVLEVHCRHPETPETNADYATAHGARGLETYVEAVRFTELALGTGLKAPHPAEDAMRAYRVQP